MGKYLVRRYLPHSFSQRSNRVGDNPLHSVGRKIGDDDRQNGDHQSGHDIQGDLLGKRFKAGPDYDGADGLAVMFDSPCHIHPVIRDFNCAFGWRYKGFGVCLVA